MIILLKGTRILVYLTKATYNLYLDNNLIKIYTNKKINLIKNNKIRC